MTDRTARLTTTILAAALVAALAAPVAGGEPAAPVTGRQTAGSDGLRPMRVGLAASGLALVDETRLADTVGERPDDVGISHTAAPDDKKSPMLALLMSAVLPGWGQLYTGHTTRAKVFFTAEALIWVGYATYTVQGNMREDDYKEYASVYAGVAGGMGSGYYEDVADYIRNEGDDSYNQRIRRDARSLYPDDLEAQEAYLRANGYFDNLAWDWDSEARFQHYRFLRHEASIADQHAFYMTGLMVLNRAVSAIDAAWMARRYNLHADGGPTARLSITPEFFEGEVGSRVALEVIF